MVVLMAVTAVPMSGFVGLELPKWSQGLATRASAATSGYYTYTVSNGKATIAAGNKSLKGNVTIPSKLGGYPVTAIGDSAFINLSGIKSVTIPNSVTRIGYNAFNGCTGLASIKIPDSVSSISSDAFADTAWYQAQPFGDVYAGKVYYKYKGTMLENTSVVIKTGTKGIAGSAFSKCDGLTSITIPDSVTSIGDSAFSYCGLTNITIPNRVTSIGDSAFFDCYGLTNITIPDSVTSIGNFAFRYCVSLKSIIIPDSVTELGSGAFNRCTQLTSVTIGNGIETIYGRDIYWWTSTFGDCPLSTIKIGKNVKTIGAEAFSGIKEIPEIYYAGSEADWKKISIDQSNDMILRATMHYNADITHTHSYTSALTKKATCTESGVKTFTCDCGKTYTEEISATGHKTSSWITDKDATCTAGGTRHKECTVCKTVLSTGTIAAKGHSFVSEITAATCTSIGYETKTCKTCGECHFVRKIPATGHTLKTDVEPATFTESGLSTTSCKTCGTITKATLIKRIASVTLSATKYAYNGKTQTPTVVVKDSAGKVLKNKTDYTVSYASGRKNPGKYAVKVTFKGNYTGTKTLYFTISPTAPSLTVTAGAKKATLKWNKQVGATGYVVYMATSKNGKYSRIAVLKGNSAVSYTKTGLTTGRTYYFKIASYTTSGTSYIYSAWSSVKGVKIK